MSSTHEYIKAQQEHLRHRQQGISNHLFELGVVSRIVGEHDPSAGIKTNLEGVAQLDKIFVPALNTAQDGDKTEKVLSLAAITPEANGRGYTYFKLAMIDETGILYPLPGVDKADAEAILATATDLIADRDDGILPGLDGSLLNINNPYNGMTRLPKSPEQ